MSPDFSHALVKRLNALSNDSLSLTFTAGINPQTSSQVFILILVLVNKYKELKIENQAFFLNILNMIFPHFFTDYKIVKDWEEIADALIKKLEE